MALYQIVRIIDFIDVHVHFGGTCMRNNSTINTCIYTKKNSHKKLREKFDKRIIKAVRDFGRANRS